MESLSHHPERQITIELLITMEIFRKLGKQVEGAWREKNYLGPGDRGLGVEGGRYSVADLGVGRDRVGTAGDGAAAAKGPARQFRRSADNDFCRAEILRRCVFLARRHDGRSSAFVLRGLSGADGLQHP